MLKPPSGYIVLIGSLLHFFKVNIRNIVIGFALVGIALFLTTLILRTGLCTTSSVALVVHFFGSGLEHLVQFFR